MHSALTKTVASVLAVFCVALAAGAQSEKPPVRLAIVGLTHDHAYGFIPRLHNRADVQLVGIVETNQGLIASYSQRFGLDRGLFYPSIDELFAHTNVQAVATFTSTFEHRRVVEACAPHGATVMVEKPLAVNMSDARAIEAAAKQANISVIVNYETTWSPANQAAYVMVHDQGKIGEVRKVVVHDGHRGPREIGVSADFFNWLTDPVLDGGGALMDFGCYGADLTTWLMDGRAPDSVMAVTQQFKPEIYTNVEDEATIIMTYPKAQAILQASWNWPFDRKDVEIYGRTGYVLAPDRSTLRVRLAGAGTATDSAAPELSGANADPVSYLVAVARGEMQPSGLSGLPVNMVVMEILDAARESARTGRRVDLKGGGS